jgi:hypothetical protein
MGDTMVSLAMASTLRGWAIAEAEDIQAGICAMPRGIAVVDALGFRYGRPWFAGLLAWYAS